jgi:pyruvate dehydrogenase E2 component (dihydrolipoamide acetyltransferase)
VIGKKGEMVEKFQPEQDIKEEKQVKSEPEPPGKKELLTDESEPERSEGIRISPRARRTAERLKVNINGITGSGPYGRIIENDILEKSRNMPKATPLARSISSKDHLDLPPAGSGVGGKITASDIRERPGIDITGEFEEKKISNIRRIIAQNMHASLQNTAQLTLHTSADARKIKKARNLVKIEKEKGSYPNITINDMVCYATVQAIQKFPAINVHFSGDTMRYFKNIHLGFAVDTSRGLMVPTVKNANHLKIEGLSSMMKELALKAQEGSIDPELLKGATFTITNLGAFGIEMFTPVLNPPQIGILGINTITLQPADLEGGGFGFIPRIGLSLTFDHRGIDGAPAASFLQEVVHQIETFELS